MTRKQTEPLSRPYNDPPIGVLFLGRSDVKPHALIESQAKEFGLRIAAEDFATDNFDTRIDTHKPEILLIHCDQTQRSGDVMQLLQRARTNYPALKTVISMEESNIEFSVTAVQSGARGLFFWEQAAGDTIGRCIRSVHQGKVWISNDILVEVLNAFSKLTPAPPPSRKDYMLSPREREVRALVIQGLSNREIANALRVTENTVKKYVYEVFNKTGASNRVELVLQAVGSTPVV